MLATFTAGVFVTLLLFNDPGGTGLIIEYSFGTIDTAPTVDTAASILVTKRFANEVFSCFVVYSVVISAIFLPYNVSEA